MFAELGHISLVLAFSLSAINLGTSVKFYLNDNNIKYFNIANNLLFYSSLLLITSFFILILNYINSNFSLLNIYNNSHSSKPFIYKLSGTWGNHEGSLMMWLAF